MDKIQIPVNGILREIEYEMVGEKLNFTSSVKFATADEARQFAIDVAKALVDWLTTNPS